jgi:hypothetical protein
VTTVHLLAVSYESEPGWAVRARHRHHKSKLDKFLRAAVPSEARKQHDGVWFVSQDYTVELREILADVHRGDEIKFCERCEQSLPCSDAWSRRMLDGAGFFVGDAREDAQVFDDIEEMLAWFDTHKPPPSANPFGTTRPADVMTSAEAAKLLGVTLPTTNEQVDAAFKQAAFKNHPDRGGSNEAMAKIIQARAALRSA